MKTLLLPLRVLHLLYGIVIFFGVLLLILPFIILIGLIFPPKTSLRFIFYFMWFWDLALNTFTGFPVFVKQSPNLDKKRSYIYISNHNSYLDSPAIVKAIPVPFKPLGKVEMMKIPLFSIVYKKVCVLIDRSSKESREASVQQLKDELAQGISILIFPEGTMNKSLDVPLAEFYDGAFRIAIETQTPIAPYVIIGARKFLPRDKPLAIRPGIIHCYGLDPIDVSGMTLEHLPELKAKVHAQMTAAILKNS